MMGRMLLLGGGKNLLLTLTLLALVAVAAIIAADIARPANAQSDDVITGRIVARLLEDGRVEFGWQPTTGLFGLPPIGVHTYPRILPRQRYLPADAQVGRWLRSSPVESGDEAIGRINARRLSDGRIEFGFTPTDRERILTDARYFPTNARANRWLRSTEITIGAPISFIAVATGYAHTCAIRESGAIACWGDNTYGQSDAPEGNFTDVSAGFSHTCAIGASSGEVACWGDNTYGMTNTPTGSYTALSAGYAHNCAIAETFAGTNTTADTGELECWGWNELGRIDAPEGRFRTVSAAGSASCAIRDTGEIACWGEEGQGQVGGDFVDVDGNPVSIPGPPEGSYTTVSAGGTNTCAIRTNDSALACWGRDGNANSDDKGWLNHYAPEGSFTTVSNGGRRACAIRDTGELACWGENEDGELARSDTGRTDAHLDAPAGNFTAVAVSTGGHSCAIRDTGEIECWGRNDEGQATPPTD